ncbi:TPA: restriction endonuclease subunit S [Photobacterium damselae]
MKPKKWTTKSLGEISKFKSGGTPSKSNPNFWGGDIPWVTAKDMKTPLINNSIDKLTPEALKVAKLAPCETLLILVRGMTLHKDLPLAITTRELAFNQDIKALTTCKEVLPMFLMVYLSSQKHKILQLVDSAGHGTGRLDTELLKSFPINYPTIFEQKQIVGVLATWENAIEKTEALIAAKEKQFEWLKSQLLLNNPKSKRWNTSTLGEFIVEKKEKSTTPDLYPCLTSSRRGIFLQEDYFSKQVASKDNSGYKIMSRGDFTFRSMSDDGLFVFNKQTIINKGLISPAYGVFSPKQNIDSDFLYYFLNSPAFRRDLSREVQGGTRTALKLNALKKLEVKIPCIQEQKDIASKLNIAKKEIDLVKELLEKYRSQKRGLMKKLLTSEWQVGSSQHLSEETYQEASA